MRRRDFLRRASSLAGAVIVAPGAACELLAASRTQAPAAIDPGGLRWEALGSYWDLDRSIYPAWSPSLTVHRDMAELIRKETDRELMREYQALQANPPLVVTGEDEFGLHALINNEPVRRPRIPGPVRDDDWIILANPGDARVTLK